MRKTFWIFVMLFAFLQPAIADQPAVQRDGDMAMVSGCVQYGPKGEMYLVSPCPKQKRWRIGGQFSTFSFPNTDFNASALNFNRGSSDRNAIAVAIFDYMRRPNSMFSLLIAYRDLTPAEAYSLLSGDRNPGYSAGDKISIAGGRSASLSESDRKPLRGFLDFRITDHIWLSGSYERGRSLTVDTRSWHDYIDINEVQQTQAIPGVGSVWYLRMFRRYDTEWMNYRFMTQSAGIAVKYDISNSRSRFDAMFTLGVDASLVTRKLRGETVYHTYRVFFPHDWYPNQPLSDFRSIVDRYIGVADSTTRTSVRPWFGLDGHVRVAGPVGLSVEGKVYMTHDSVTFVNDTMWGQFPFDVKLPRGAVWAGLYVQF